MAASTASQTTLYDHFRFSPLVIPCCPPWRPWSAPPPSPPSTPAPPCPGWGRGRTTHQVNNNTHNINILHTHNHFIVLFLAVLLSAGFGFSLVLVDMDKAQIQSGLTVPCKEILWTYKLFGDYISVSGPEIVTMGEWTPRKLEKQRSVTFASIDLLEPIEEDFPQVFDLRITLLRLSIFLQESRVWL